MGSMVAYGSRISAVPPRSSISMRSRIRIAALAGRVMAAKRGLLSIRSMLKLHRRQRLEGKFCVGEDQLDHALDEIGLDRGVGTALDTRRARAAPAAQQHVDHRIDQAGIDGDEPEILPLLGLEHRQNGRQRDRVDIVTEAHRRDAVERNFDVVGREIAQAVVSNRTSRSKTISSIGRRSVGHHRAIDDGADAGIVVEIDVGQAEAEQTVDFVLIEDALGAPFGLTLLSSIMAAQALPPSDDALTSGAALQCRCRRRCGH